MGRNLLQDEIGLHDLFQIFQASDPVLDAVLGALPAKNTMELLGMGQHVLDELVDVGPQRKVGLGINDLLFLYVISIGIRSISRRGAPGCVL